MIYEPNALSFASSKVEASTSLVAGECLMPIYTVRPLGPRPQGTLLMYCSLCIRRSEPQPLGHRFGPWLCVHLLLLESVAFTSRRLCEMSHDPAGMDVSALDATGKNGKKQSRAIWKEAAGD